MSTPNTPTSQGWIWTGWIMNPPSPICKKNYAELKVQAAKIDHGEERLVIDRPDGSGADCYYREVKP